MKIEIKIEEYYINGQRTCAAWFGEGAEQKACPMLMTTGLGYEFQCRLFSPAFGACAEHLKRSVEHGGIIIPHETCLKLSEEQK